MSLVCRETRATQRGGAEGTVVGGGVEAVFIYLSLRVGWKPAGSERSCVRGRGGGEEGVDLSA